MTSPQNQTSSQPMPTTDQGFSESLLIESDAPSTEWFTLHHSLPAPETALLFEACSVLTVLNSDNHLLIPLTELKKWRQHWHNRAKASGSSYYQAAKVAISVVADLIIQGWLIKCEGTTIYMAQPLTSADRKEEQQRIRRALAVARDEQLESRSVRDFLADMERPRPRGGVKKAHSIFSLMRDGEELASSLKNASQIDDEKMQQEELTKCIKPYLQFVSSKERCQFTGFRLNDIWRYFRYTWLTPGRSTPGRSMMILVRDGAATNHPIIGIAALSSSIVQQSERDMWIGWDRGSILQQLRESPEQDDATWLLNSLQESIDDLYLKDFKREKIINRSELNDPTDDVFERLKALAAKERTLHQQRAMTAGYRPQQGKEDWKTLVNSPLYRYKRADALSKLLKVRSVFNRFAFTSVNVANNGQEILIEALESASFRDAVGRLVRHIKSRRVGINMMDISVAGAIAPYNALLGGKLVSLLLTSPEVQTAYFQRYHQAASVIASGMKGEPVMREPHLVLLCTTGLFSYGSSQYNRIKIGVADIANQNSIERYGFYRLQQNTTYGTFHFSDATLHEMQIYSEQHHEGSEVHGIFGEGVNPKMRKIREALYHLGFPSDELLQAGSPRALYVVPLARNFRRILIGKDKQPDYFFPHKSNEPMTEATQQLVEFWRKRWFFKRAVQLSFQNDLRCHSLTIPLNHGAAVKRSALVEDEDESKPFQPVLPIFDLSIEGAREEESYEYPTLDIHKLNLANHT